MARSSSRRRRGRSSRGKSDASFGGLAAVAIAGVAIIAGVVWFATRGGNFEEHYHRALAHRAAGDLPAAVIEFKNALDAEPRHAEARWHLAHVYLELRDGANAETELQRAKTLGFVSPDFPKLFVRAALFQSDYKKALERIRAGGGEENTEWRLLLADALLGSGDVGGAEAAYGAAYGRLLENIPIRLMNYRVTVTGRRPAFDMGVFAPAGGRPAADCAIGSREVYAEGRFWTATVYERLELEAGAVVPGPALLEQADATIFIDPGLSGRVDGFGNLLIAVSRTGASEQ